MRLHRSVRRKRLRQRINKDATNIIRKYKCFVTVVAGHFFCALTVFWQLVERKVGGECDKNKNSLHNDRKGESPTFSKKTAT